MPPEWLENENFPFFFLDMTNFCSIVNNISKILPNELKNNKGENIASLPFLKAPQEQHLGSKYEICTQQDDFMS